MNVWPAAGSVDGELSSSDLVFELERAEIADGRVSADRVVEPLDVVEHLGPGGVTITALQPDYYGGNMDLPDVGVGAVIYLPVNIKGGLLYLGDCHAAQGDGELCGVAIEHPTVTTLQIDLIKGWSVKIPRLETKDFIMSIGASRPLEDAARMAYRDLIRWMAADYGFEEIDAYMLLTQCGRVRLGNMVDPKYTMGASIKKSFLV